MPLRTVKPGECMASIAHDEGFLWETLWNHPENKGLKEKRDPNVLTPDEDKVFIPERKSKSFTRPADAVHRFKLKADPVTVRLRFSSGNSPRAGVPYKLTVEGELVSTDGARTDDNGGLECEIAPDAEEATLELGEGDARTIYTLKLGHLNPVETVSGVKQRLLNLGFYQGGIDDEQSDELKAAVLQFGVSRGLKKPSETIDKDVEDALREMHER